MNRSLGGQNDKRVSQPLNKIEQNNQNYRSLNGKR